MLRAADNNILVNPALAGLMAEVLLLLWIRAQFVGPDLIQL